MQPLLDLGARNQQPVRREVWLGLEFKPAKRCAIAIDSANLPTDAECRAVAGLDVILCFHGYATRYGVLRRLCGGLYQASPRRLLLIDFDYKRTAFLKMGAP